MNKFASIFIILLFVTLIAVGALAVRERLFSQSEAMNRCQTPVISADQKCPAGKSLKLIQQPNGCYEVECKP